MFHTSKKWLNTTFTFFNLYVFSCGPVKAINPIKNKYSNSTKQLINHAKSFEGTPYLYGGNTSKGMDNSGLIHTVYKSVDYNIPRTSLAIYRDGKALKLNTLKMGIYCFKTQEIVNNHVGRNLY